MKKDKTTTEIIIPEIENIDIDPKKEAAEYLKSIGCGEYIDYALGNGNEEINDATNSEQPAIPTKTTKSAASTGGRTPVMLSSSTYQKVQSLQTAILLSSGQKVPKGQIINELIDKYHKKMLTAKGIEIYKVLTNKES